MRELWQRVRHILYRQKVRLLLFSPIARRVRSLIWSAPAPGVVEVIYRREQDISHYFDWKEPDDKIANKKLREFTGRYANEPDIVYRVKGNLIIEPDHGLAINEGRQFVPQSGTLSHPYLKPSLISYLRHKYFNGQYTEIDTVIHCDGFAGLNLCHFIYDTLNPILFLHLNGMIGKDDKILISEKVFQRPFFQYFLKNTFMGSLNWYRQAEGEWIRVRKFRKALVSMEVFPATFKLFKTPDVGQRKIFLDRRSRYQRNIRNLSVLQPVLDKNGFETVYAEDLSYVKQVELFRQVRYFVGIHGAGLTNLLHSNIPSLRVLEIFSESMVHASFYRFLKILGVEYYDAITGSPLNINWSFSVDKDEFVSKVHRLLQS